MNQEQNTGTPPAQGKPASNKRNNRNGRNRPVLVTGDSTDQVSGTSTQETMSAPTTTVPAAAEETSPIKKRPSFFSTIGRKEETADAAAARLARPTRNKAAAPVKKKAIKETKRSQPTALLKSAPTRAGGNAAPAPRGGGLKPPHLIGMRV